MAIASSTRCPRTSIVESMVRVALMPKDVNFTRDDNLSELSDAEIRVELRRAFARLGPVLTDEEELDAVVVYLLKGDVDDEVFDVARAAK